ncbi:MAG: cell division ATP-binding protein FtsE [Leucobacter sp.]
MILFENVAKKYRGTQRPALDGIDLQIDRGEFVFIVGASGSGKSSCLRLVLREEQPSVGNVHVLGHDLSKISSRKVPYFRRNLGMVFQDFRLLTNKTVYDNVAFSLQVIGKSRGFIQEAVPDTLEMVGLGNKGKRYPHELSGGEQQRVAIARAIVNKPAILMADEPTGNLDPATSLGIMQLLRAINAAGTTIVMATHEATFVDIMRQRVIELSQGVVVRDEDRGGYGETASIPVSGFSEASAKVLRTSEDVVRQALSPGAVVDSAVVEGLGDPYEEVVMVPGATPIEVPPAQGRGFDGLGNGGEDSAPDTEAGGDEDTLRTQSSDRTPRVSDPRVPAFLEPEYPVAPVYDDSEPEPDEPIDPVKEAQQGGIAGRLGLSRKDDDDQTDVGPVR